MAPDFSTRGIVYIPASLDSNAPLPLYHLVDGRRAASPVARLAVARIQRRKIIFVGRDGAGPSKLGVMLGIHAHHPGLPRRNRICGIIQYQARMGGVESGPRSTVGAVGPDLKSRLKVLGCPRQGRQIISRSVRSSLQTDLVYPSYSLKIVLTPPFYSLKSKFLENVTLFGPLNFILSASEDSAVQRVKMIVYGVDISVL